MNEPILIICCLQTIIIIAMAYFHYKTVTDMSAKLIARDLHEVKAYQAKPEKHNPNDDIPKSDELIAMEFELEDKKRIDALKKEAVGIGQEIAAKSWGV